ncbi:MAG TPA: serine/threonine-protein kinase [Planctomycetota bacterium]|nr:serine/threonine-protein kinase [Planctomycetota bacterium]
MSDLNGQTVAGYPIQKILSKGSYVEIYQAASSGAPLAVRVLREDLRSNSFLKTSVIKGWENARSVQHPNLKVVFSTGDDPKAGAFTLEELISGKSLRQMMLGGPKVAWRDCLILAEQLFSAIEALHKAGKIHGEIWPGSIIITQDQDLKLEAAGGLASLSMPLTDFLEGPAVGYLAPEIIHGSPLSVESDLYAAGAVLHFIMSGQDPYPGEDAAVIAHAVIERKPAPLSALRDDVPAEAEEFIGRLMAKDATQRYGLASDVAADIQRLKAGQPMGPLKGGKPPAPPRPVRKPAAMSSLNTAVETEKKASGAALQARLSGTGLKAVDEVKKTSGFLNQVKGASAARVFGRLETHVKSTIPQSDTEKRGDDYYRQGQLPMALASWKEAFASGTPHAALKIKIELGEKEVKKEAYSASIDEARHRIQTGDYKGAINKAREAMLNCDSEQQRQDAVKLEQEAIARSQEASKSGNIKIIAGAAVFVIVLIISFKFIGKEETPVYTHPTDQVIVKTDEGKKKETQSRYFIPEAQATVLQPANWTVKDNVLTLAGGGGAQTIIMRVNRMTGMSVAQRMNEMRKNSGLKEGLKVDDLENFALIQNIYPVSEMSFTYSRDDGVPAVRYNYFLTGPQDAIFSVVFDGEEKYFDSKVRGQLREIILSWAYKQ